MIVSVGFNALCHFCRWFCRWLHFHCFCYFDGIHVFVALQLVIFEMHLYIRMENKHGERERAYSMHFPTVAKYHIVCGN